MAEQDKNYISEVTKTFIKRAFTDGVGEKIRRQSAHSTQAFKTVPAWEQREQILRQTAAGVPFAQIAEETGIDSTKKIIWRYQEGLRDLWNQSPKETQEDFSMGQVFAMPKRGHPGPKRG